MKKLIVFVPFDKAHEANVVMRQLYDSSADTFVIGLNGAGDSQEAATHLWAAFSVTSSQQAKILPELGKLGANVYDMSLTTPQAALSQMGLSPIGRVITQQNDDFTAITGVGATTQDLLYNAGVTTFIIATMRGVDSLAAIDGISPVLAERIFKYSQSQTNL